MDDFKFVFKGSLYLFARYVLICVLVFMTVPLSGILPNILNPILGFFYLFVLLYFFIFTMWHEGKRDKNRVETGQLKELKSKGFICAAIVAVFLSIFVVSPMFFSPDSESVVLTVLAILKTAFCMPIAYLIPVFFNLDVDIESSYGGNIENLTASTILFLIVMAICIISCGIGYISGYKSIQIIEPVKQKVKNLFK